MTDDNQTTAKQDDDGSVIVVGPDGRPMGTVESDGTLKPDEPGNLIEQPAKVMRIGSMIKQLLEEVKAAPLDEASRGRLREIHQRSITELEDGLAPELREELERLSLPFEGDAPPSEAELRIAQAQLVGWLEGLFHGIQTALVAQQVAARLQLEQIRGGGAIPGRPALPVGPQGAENGRAGQYL
ncbi:bacterial proteasome activator family protein [Actinoplanes sp. NPDC051470]|uniref:bacterial proteasome activator family protein n=1 Tax=unclassified Actinoplanes TaxID=2626549 RepID=UPI00342F665E